MAGRQAACGVSVGGRTGLRCSGTGGVVQGGGVGGGITKGTKAHERHEAPIPATPGRIRFVIVDAPLAKGN